VDYSAQREYQGFSGTSDESKMVVLLIPDAQACHQEQVFAFIEGIRHCGGRALLFVYPSQCQGGDFCGLTILSRRWLQDKGIMVSFPRRSSRKRYP
jgi:hypothetical protein